MTDYRFPRQKQTVPYTKNLWYQIIYITSYCKTSTTTHFLFSTDARLTSDHVRTTKAPSTPATMSKQRSTLLRKSATMSHEFIVKFRPFDKVECCFDTVAVFGNNVVGFGNNVEQHFVFSTKSTQIEPVQFVSTLSKGRNFVRHYCQNRQNCYQKQQQCRSNIRLCRKNRSTCSIRQCCFDIVAGVAGA